MAQRMLSAADNLQCTGQYLMNNAARQNRNDYNDDSFDMERDFLFEEDNQPRAATITAFINRFIVAIANGAKRFCTVSVTTVTETVQWLAQTTARNVISIFTPRRLLYCLPIFILLLLSGLWGIPYLLNMPHFQTKSESLNTDSCNSFENQSSVSDENKDEMPIVKESLENSVSDEFSHIRPDVKQEVSAILAKFPYDVKKKFINSQFSISESFPTDVKMDFIRSKFGISESFPTDVKKDFIRSKFSISESFLQSLIDEALGEFNADKIDMADFALESQGGSVISILNSETLKESCFGILGIPLYCKQKQPEAAIQPNVNAGECWPFVGSIGTLVIKLSHKIKITAFSMEHIPKSISPYGHIESAPKDFSVYSLTEKHDHTGVLLGNFTYEDNGRVIQQFVTQVKNVKPTQFVKLLITSNHGNLKYTCLYRFRVHGVPPSP